MKPTLVYLLLMAILLNLPINSAKYTLTELKVGTDPSHIVRFSPNVKNVNGLLDLKGTIYLLQDMTNENMYMVKINRVNPKTNQERPMVNMKGKGVCDVLNKYLGSVFHDVERIASVPSPGKCPIVKGNYTLTDWYHLDLDKVPLFTMVPNAIYRLDLRMMSIDGKKILGTINFKFNKSI